MAREHRPEANALCSHLRCRCPAWGMLLLLLYSLRHSLLVLVAGTSIGFVKQVTSSGKYGTFSIELKYAMGAVVLLIALHMFYLGF